jgi:hypothetical protein
LRWVVRRVGRTLTELGADLGGDLGIHQLGDQPRDALAQHVGVLAGQQLVDQLGSSHPGPVGHRGVSFVCLREQTDDHEARDGRTHIRPAGSPTPLSATRPGVHSSGWDGCASGAVLGRFRQRVRAAGLPRIRLHDVRHSYATAALAAGVPAKVVSERLGHANIAIAMDTYSHVLPGLDEQAAGQVARLILGAGDPVPGMLREQTVSIRPPSADQPAGQDRKGAG